MSGCEKCVKSKTSSRDDIEKKYFLRGKVKKYTLSRKFMKKNGVQYFSRCQRHSGRSGNIHTVIKRDNQLLDVGCSSTSASKCSSACKGDPVMETVPEDPNAFSCHKDCASAENSLLQPCKGITSTLIPMSAQVSRMLISGNSTCRGGKDNPRRCRKQNASKSSDSCMSPVTDDNLMTGREGRPHRVPSMKKFSPPVTSCSVIGPNVKDERISESNPSGDTFPFSSPEDLFPSLNYAGSGSSCLNDDGDKFVGLPAEDLLSSPRREKSTSQPDAQANDMRNFAKHYVPDSSLRVHAKGMSQSQMLAPSMTALPAVSFADAASSLPSVLTVPVLHGHAKQSSQECLSSKKALRNLQCKACGKGRPPAVLRNLQCKACGKGRPPAVTLAGDLQHSEEIATSDPSSVTVRRTDSLIDQLSKYGTKRVEQYLPSTFNVRSTLRSVDSVGCCRLPYLNSCGAACSDMASTRSSGALHSKTTGGDVSLSRTVGKDLHPRLSMDAVSSQRRGKALPSSQTRGRGKSSRPANRGMSSSTSRPGAPPSENAGGGVKSGGYGSSPGLAGAGTSRTSDRIGQPCRTYKSRRLIFKLRGSSELANGDGGKISSATGNITGTLHVTQNRVKAETPDGVRDDGQSYKTLRMLISQTWVANKPSPLGSASSTVTTRVRAAETSMKAAKRRKMMMPSTPFPNKSALPDGELEGIASSERILVRDASQARPQGKLASSGRVLVGPAGVQASAKPVPQGGVAVKNASLASPKVESLVREPLKDMLLLRAPVKRKSPVGEEADVMAPTRVPVGDESPVGEEANVVAPTRVPVGGDESPVWELMNDVTLIRAPVWEQVKSEPSAGTPVNVSPAMAMVRNSSLSVEQVIKSPARAPVRNSSSGRASVIRSAAKARVTESPARTRTNGSPPTAPIKNQPSSRTLVRNTTPARTPVKSSSPTRTQGRNTSPARAPLKNKSPTRAPLKIESPARTQGRNTSPTRPPLKIKLPARTQGRNTSPARAPLKIELPIRTQGRNTSPTRAPVMNKSPTRTQERDTSLARAPMKIKSPARAPVIRSPVRTPVKIKSPAGAPVKVRSPVRAPVKIRSPARAPVKIRSPARTTTEKSISPSRAQIHGMSSASALVLDVSPAVAVVNDESPFKVPVRNRPVTRASVRDKALAGLPAGRVSRARTRARQASPRKTRTKQTSPIRARTRRISHASAPARCNSSARKPVKGTSGVPREDVFTARAPGKTVSSTRLSEKDVSPARTPGKDVSPARTSVKDVSPARRSVKGKQPSMASEKDVSPVRESEVMSPTRAPVKGEALARARKGVPSTRASGKGDAPAKALRKSEPSARGSPVKARVKTVALARAPMKTSSLGWTLEEDFTLDQILSPSVAPVKRMPSLRTTAEDLSTRETVKNASRRRTLKKNYVPSARALAKDVSTTKVLVNDVPPVRELVKRRPLTRASARDASPTRALVKDVIPAKHTSRTRSRVKQVSSRETREVKGSPALASLTKGIPQATAPGKILSPEAAPVKSLSPTSTSLKCVLFVRAPAKNHAHCLSPNRSSLTLSQATLPQKCPSPVRTSVESLPLAAVPVKDVSPAREQASGLPRTETSVKTVSPLESGKDKTSVRAPLKCVSAVRTQLRDFSISLERLEDVSPARAVTHFRAPVKDVSPTWVSGMNNVPARAPAQEVSSARSPVKDISPTRVPVKNTFPARAPIKNISPAGAPVKAISPARALVKDVSPARSLVKNMSADRAPVKNISQARAPRKNVSPARAPRKNVSPARAPGKDILPARTPVKNITPTRTPVKDVSPARAPVKNSSPAMVPQKGVSQAWALKKDVLSTKAPLTELSEGGAQVKNASSTGLLVKDVLSAGEPGKAVSEKDSALSRTPVKGMSTETSGILSRVPVKGSLPARTRGKEALVSKKSVTKGRAPRKNLPPASAPVKGASFSRASGKEKAPSWTSVERASPSRASKKDVSQGPVKESIASPRTSPDVDEPLDSTPMKTEPTAVNSVSLDSAQGTIVPSMVSDYGVTSLRTEGNCLLTYVASLNAVSPTNASREEIPLAKFSERVMHFDLSPSWTCNEDAQMANTEIKEELSSPTMLSSSSVPIRPMVVLHPHSLEMLLGDGRPGNKSLRYLNGTQNSVSRNTLDQIKIDVGNQALKIDKIEYSLLEEDALLKDDHPGGTAGTDPHVNQVMVEVPIQALQGTSETESVIQKSQNAKEVRLETQNAREVNNAKGSRKDDSSVIKPTEETSPSHTMCENDPKIQSCSGKQVNLNVDEQVAVDGTWNRKYSSPTSINIAKGKSLKKSKETEGVEDFKIVSSQTFSADVKNNSIDEVIESVVLNNAVRSPQVKSPRKINVRCHDSSPLLNRDDLGNKTNNTTVAIGKAVSADTDLTVRTTSYNDKKLFCHHAYTKASNSKFENGYSKCDQTARSLERCAEQLVCSRVGHEENERYKRKSVLDHLPLLSAILMNRTGKKRKEAEDSLQDLENEYQSSSQSGDRSTDSEAIGTIGERTKLRKTSRKANSRALPLSHRDASKGGSSVSSSFSSLSDSEVGDQSGASFSPWKNVPSGIFTESLSYTNQLHDSHPPAPSRKRDCVRSFKRKAAESGVVDCLLKKLKLGSRLKDTTLSWNIPVDDTFCVENWVDKRSERDSTTQPGREESVAVQTTGAASSLTRRPTQSRKVTENDSLPLKSKGSNDKTEDRDTAIPTRVSFSMTESQGTKSEAALPCPVSGGGSGFSSSCSQSQRSGTSGSSDRIWTSCGNLASEAYWSPNLENCSRTEMYRVSNRRRDLDDFDLRQSFKTFSRPGCKSNGGRGIIGQKVNAKKSRRGEGSEGSITQVCANESESNHEMRRRKLKKLKTDRRIFTPEGKLEENMHRNKLMKDNRAHCRWKITNLRKVISDAHEENRLDLEKINFHEKSKLLGRVKRTSIKIDINKYRNYMNKRYRR